ncbi:GDYXXLXY domain-containing protein [Campylobacter sp. 9BO]|uniref:GDYXXLXY domain-containing protein n=1 Tax=Campylobacter sp. 9BO TaxID=3424759 RepID=UPI003D336982
MKKFSFLIFLVQPILLVGMFFYAYMPIWLGDDVFIKAQGYDPRDFFRGNYVHLSYDFNQMDVNVSESYSNKIYEIYAILEKDGELYKTSKISLEKPKDGIYISGKYDYLSSFGVEKYFQSKDKALKLEKKLMDSEFEAIAHLKIYKGDARLINIELVKIEKSNK